MEIVQIGEKLKDKKYGFRETCFGICEKNGKMLLVKKDGQYSFIGGGREENETREECLKREFLEESGYSIKSIKEFVTVDCFWLAGGKWPLESLANFYIVEVEKFHQEPLEEGHIIEEIEISEVQNLLPLPYQNFAFKFFLKNKKDIKNK